MCSEGAIADAVSLELVNNRGSGGPRWRQGLLPSRARAPGGGTVLWDRVPGAVTLPGARSVHGDRTPDGAFRKSVWAITNAALTFAGEFGGVDATAWIRFARAVWPGLRSAGVRSVRLADRREVAGLAQRLVRLRGLISSTSFQVGTAALTAANQPQALWRLPATIWRL